jgi:hypothetical protein
MASSDNEARQRTSFMWEVVPTNLFLIYAHDSPPESGIFADLLVEISGEGSLNGSFRWSLRKVDGYELSYEVKPGDLPFRHNTSTTSWEDMADLITEGKISVTKDGEDAQHEFIGKITCLIRHSQTKTTNSSQILFNQLPKFR